MLFATLRLVFVTQKLLSIMNIYYISHTKLLTDLSQRNSNSLEFVMLITGALDDADEQRLPALLLEAVRVLKDGGVLFVQGIPAVLPAWGVFLEKLLTFKYWLAVESTPIAGQALPSVHGAVMLFTKGVGRFNIKRVRLPHQYCQACGRTLKDWGGKAHLMNPQGYVISDVIKDLPAADNYRQMSKPLFELLIAMLDFRSSPINGLVGPVEGLAWKRMASDRHPALPFSSVKKSADQQIDQPRSAITSPAETTNLFNVIHQGDALEILSQYPDESIDLVFADPPYNLDKDYTLYDDEQAEQQYVAWCHRWLAEYARILKPTGSLFVLNLPRWALYQATFLNQQLYFQNWIVWDALSEPRGKVLPAHYALLFYTKQPTGFTFNYEAVSPIEARHYCLRASCRKRRKKAGDDQQTPLNDIWWDIHRIKHRRDRDYHPCQLPPSLVARIIRLATHPGEVVLDAFGGAGTTPLVALQLGRQYVAIDIDPNYVSMTQNKIAQVENLGHVPRQSVKQASRPVTKKALQLELRQLSVELGRLPTPADVAENSQYDLELFLETFPSWDKALQAAKLKLQLYQN